MIDQKSIMGTMFQTEFFRYSGFFEYYRNEVIPDLKKRQTVRILSMGCSVGKEAYSIHLTNEREGLKAIIEGKDREQEVLDIGQKGEFHISVYEWETLKEFEDRLEKYYGDDFFKRYYGEEVFERYFKNRKRIPLRIKINADIDFSLFDLQKEELPENYYDVIVGFATIESAKGFKDKEDKIKAIDKLYAGLKQGGYLFLDPEYNSDNGIRREDIKYDLFSETNDFRLIRK